MFIYGSVPYGWFNIGLAVLHQRASDLGDVTTVWVSFFFFFIIDRHRVCVINCVIWGVREEI